jgi:hypothetical protein
MMMIHIKLTKVTSKNICKWIRDTKIFYAKMKIDFSDDVVQRIQPIVWDQEVCSLCDLRFKPCGCSYDGHWRLTWSLTSGPVGLVEVRASWPGHPR